MKSYRGIFITQVDRKMSILFTDHQGDTCLLLCNFWICKVNIRLQMHMPSKRCIVFKTIKWIFFLKLQCLAILTLQDEVDTDNTNAFNLETLIGS